MQEGRARVHVARDVRLVVDCRHASCLPWAHKSRASHAACHAFGVWLRSIVHRVVHQSPPTAQLTLPVQQALWRPCRVSTEAMIVSDDDNSKAGRHHSDVRGGTRPPAAHGQRVNYLVTVRTQNQDRTTNNHSSWFGTVMCRTFNLSEGHRASQETVPEHGTLRAAAQKSTTHTKRYWAAAHRNTPRNTGPHTHTHTHTHPTPWPAPPPCRTAKSERFQSTDSAALPRPDNCNPRGSDSATDELRGARRRMSCPELH